MYLKRNKVPKFWKIERKGTKYLASPTHLQNHATPLVVMLRDVLKIVKTKKELQSMINEKKVLINNKEIKETNYPVCLFDIVSVVDMKKHFIATIEKNKKMGYEEVSDKESKKKTYKVIDKTILPKKLVQLNLMHGLNIISKEKIETGDSIVYNFKDKKIEKTIPMKKNSNVFVSSGKYAGFKGKIEDIVERGGKKIAKIQAKEDKINVWTNNIIAIE